MMKRELSCRIKKRKSRKIEKSLLSMTVETFVVPEKTPIA